MQYFTIISGIASILGFILTVANIFPAQAKVRNYITIFAIGSFIGSFIGSVKNISINFPENPVSSGILLFFIMCLVGLFFVLLAALFSEDKEKRSECFTVVGNGFGVLVIAGMIILFGIGLSKLPPDEDVSLDELLTISDINVNKGNLDRAILQLDLFARRCLSNDPRKEAALKKIAELKSQQSSLIKSPLSK